MRATRDPIVVINNSEYNGGIVKVMEDSTLFLILGSGTFLRAPITQDRLLLHGNELQLNVYYDYFLNQVLEHKDSSTKCVFLRPSLVK